MVRNVVERQQVACPAGAVQVFVERDFETRHGRDEHVPLHVRVPIAGSLAVDKEVDVVLSRSDSLQYPAGFAMHVAWNPGGGAFPRFAGDLKVTPESEERCTLELAGSYEPPGGLLGALFDSLIGRRLAQSTMRNLISRIGRSAAEEYVRRVRAGQA